MSDPSGKANADETPAGQQTLSSIRVGQGLTERDLAEKAGLTEIEVIAIEAGQVPSRPQLQALAAALNVPAEDLGLKD